MKLGFHADKVLPPDFTYRAVVRSIYDGDTIRADIDLGFNIWQYNETLRLAGIDAPEIRGEERPLGLNAKAWLENKIPPGTEILIQTYKDKKGKYGRYIADIWWEGFLVNAQMVKEGMAEPYDE